MLVGRLLAEQGVLAHLEVRGIKDQVSPEACGANCDCFLQSQAEVAAAAEVAVAETEVAVAETEVAAAAEAEVAVAETEVAVADRFAESNLGVGAIVTFTTTTNSRTSLVPCCR